MQQNLSCIKHTNNQKSSNNKLTFTILINTSMRQLKMPVLHKQTISTQEPMLRMNLVLVHCIYDIVEVK